MRNKAEALFRARQDEICAELEALDGNTFREDLWTRDEGGGGRTRVIQEGGFFEKAGVNVSAVFGPMPKEVLESAQGRGVDLGGDGAEFFATGISLVLHPHNPHAPTIHANYRYFEVERAEGDKVWWFGGGTDLTPNFLVEKDVREFHGKLKSVCDAHDLEFYPKYKAWCDRYFHIPHREEARGVGGIFFDNLADRSADDLYSFVADCSATIMPSVMPIYERQKDKPFNEEEREWQLLRRGRYVEFNLVYDRGTSFGLRTKGRTESILMSLPLTARWEYDHQVAADSPAGRLVEVLREPRDWVGSM
ncbi:MAG: oxygen-dependent coproporphyrinogen oxidase [Planctomycetota bacterium]